ncbi:uncharacterized protein BDW70DRAFT_130950 [Aspergillus foveolatus]|uniref:uncharacterized protein n=1 Tax=Aspergillus foveolatus TaxID=210207 RepID=UPI003CCDF078
MPLLLTTSFLVSVCNTSEVLPVSFVLCLFSRRFHLALVIGYTGVGTFSRYILQRGNLG